MRRYHQRQLLGIIETLNEAGSEIKRLFSVGEAQALTELLADCQESAVEIGNFIEGLEGEGTKTVEYLEEYCDLLYQISIETESPDKGKHFEKSLRKQLVKIENSIKTELKPNKIEIAFFPYKASMWDSLESIYLAAKDDPQCDAYVVPIPYYDRLPGGAFGQVHYEGGEYPDNIPITDWREYDVEARHPDVAFVHNPYDEKNYVTSVHPDYYSKRLKDLTDLLVYVPYFVVTDDVPEHFCVCPGTLHTHRVIVQSERVRETYIRVFKEFEEANNCRGKFGRPEDKFVALGSPKFDKVINTKREDCVLPDEWRKLIEKSDGTSKKVVFYNTSVGSILAGNEQYLEKLVSVFDAFRERDELVLWWRPHPLSLSTYESMRPGLAERYRQIVEEYRRGGYGIYDDTADLHRALAWSDAYYGDNSSLLAMYGITGKLAVVQNIYSAEDDVLFQFTDFSRDNRGKHWAFELEKDGLFELDFETNTARFAARSGSFSQIVDRSWLYAYRYFTIHNIGDEVICFPEQVDSIIIYSRTSGGTEAIPLDCSYLMPTESKVFFLRYTVEHNGRVYCFGGYNTSPCKAVVVYDSFNHTVQYDTELFKKIGGQSTEEQLVKYPLYMSESSEDGYITLLMRNCDRLIRYCLPSQELEYIASNPMLTKCTHADFDGQYYWLISDKNDELIKWEPDTNNTTTYAISIDGHDLRIIQNMFSGICDCGDFLLIFPWYGNLLLKFDKNSGSFSECKDIQMPEDKSNSIIKFDAPKRVGNKIYTNGRFSGTMYELDRPSGKVTPHKFRLEKDNMESFYSRCRGDLKGYTGFEIHEAYLGNIERYFSEVIFNERSELPEGRRNYQSPVLSADGNAGVSIYSFVKKSALPT